jgi:hypothetical protein
MEYRLRRKQESDESLSEEHDDVVYGFEVSVQK